MRDAAKRVLVTIAVLQGFLLLTIPAWSVAYDYIEVLPGTISISTIMLSLAVMIWGSAEVANRLVGSKDSRVDVVATPVGGMDAGDLALVLRAKDNLARVRRVMVRLGDPAAKAALEELTTLAHERLASIPDAPQQRLRGLRRALEYYLPKVIELAEGLASIQEKPEQQARAGQITIVLAELARHFRTQGEGLVPSDMRLLDVEIKMLESALGAERVRSLATNLTRAAS